MSHYKLKKKFKFNSLLGFLKKYFKVSWKILISGEYKGKPRPKKQILSLPKVTIYRCFISKIPQHNFKRNSSYNHGIVFHKIPEKVFSSGMKDFNSVQESGNQKSINRKKIKLKIETIFIEPFFYNHP